MVRKVRAIAKAIRDGRPYHSQRWLKYGFAASGVELPLANAASQIQIGDGRVIAGGAPGPLGAPVSVDLRCGRQ
jgi:hypothetical protein